MKTITSSLWAASVLGAILAAGTPAFAQYHGGGGGGGGHMGGGGGGHSFGGGHSAAPGGHAFGGGRGFGGPHFASPSFAGGARFAGGAHFAAGGFSGYRGGSYAPGSHAYSTAQFGRSAAPVAFHGGAAGGSHLAAGYGRSGFVSNGGRVYGPGFGRGGFGYYRPYWHGGYWHGGFWPRAYYGWAYPWFLPVLPGIYATYWWGGIPYYYADSVYYTWSPGYNGYVVTDPPPAADSADSAPTDDNAPTDGGQANNSSDVYVYPKNGQSDEQTATDRFECHKWATAQSGFDPTKGSQAQGSAGDYRRAMSACLDARGYSAR